LIGLFWLMKSSIALISPHLRMHLHYCLSRAGDRVLGIANG